MHEEGVELIGARVNERLSEEELLEVVTDIDGIICGDDRITERVLAAAPRLKVISKWGTGIDSIDAEAAARQGNTRVQNPQRIFRAGGGYGSGLHVDVCPQTAVAGSGHPAGPVGKTPTDGPGRMRFGCRGSGRLRQGRCAARSEFRDAGPGQ